MARKNYSEEFRRQSVDLYESTPGATVRGIAEDLGIVRGTLRQWLEAYGTGKKTAADSHERGLAVLAYLPHRIKHRDIAAELDITLNTLRTHLASIYRKLGVTDRDDAATRATETGLL